MHRISISFGPESVSAVLDDSKTAKAISEALPLEGVVNRWGEEIYFNIPLDLPEAPDARQDMAVGELGYWPAGSAFCIFFGPTPASTDEQPRAFNKVNPFGRLEGGIEALHKVKDGDPVQVSLSPD